MTMWVAYVGSGHEFDVVEVCEVLGLWAVAPRKVEAVRTGNRRYPEPRVMPYLDGYVFLEADAEQWHWIRGVKHLRSLMAVPTGETRKVHDFCEMVEANFAAKSAEIDRAAAVMKNRMASKEARQEAIRVMQQYSPGDLLEVILGPFAGQIAAFGAMVERAASKLPEIEVSLQGLEWGAMRMDPLHVRKVG